MKIRTIMTTVMISTVMFTQSVAASTSVAAQQSDASPLADDVAPVAPQKPVVQLHHEAGALESYMQLVQRIREASARELSEKLDTDALIREVLGSTLRGIVEATRGVKPQL